MAFPTETVYGLGADGTSPAAVRRIFAAKGRPGDNPLILHIAMAADLHALVRSVPREANILAREFWPGPLTMVLPRAASVPDAVTAGLDTVAVRMPSHPVALALIRAAGVPVAAPSANRSGRPSPTRAEHVLADLEGRIEVILDAGPTGVGLESTVLDLTVSPPMILRPGGVTSEDLERVLGRVELHPAAAGESVALAQARSPGMKYVHYAPEARVVLVEGDQAAVAGRVRALAEGYRTAGLRVAILATGGDSEAYSGYDVWRPGTASVAPGGRTAAVAAGLYAALRDMDRAGVEVIIVEGIDARGLGLAIMNRLRRAASERILVGPGTGEEQDGSR